MKFSRPLYLGVFLAVIAILAIAASFGAPVPHPLRPDFADNQLNAWPAIGMGGMIINRSNLAAFFTGLKTAYNNALSRVEVNYDQYAMTVPSSTAAEQYGWMGLIPGLREWIGDRQLANIRTFDFTIKNKPWERTLTVNRDHLDDDQVGIYTPMAESLAMEAKRHPQELIDALLAGGFTNLGYDGQTFFSANHPTYNADGSVTLVSNVLAGAAAPWFLVDDTRAVKPWILQLRKSPQFVSMQDETDERVFMAKEFRYGVDWRGNVGYGLWQLAFGSRTALDETNYQAARAAMMTMTGDYGRKLGLVPKLLICGPSNEGAAKKLLQADILANGATNIYKGTARLVVSPYLA